VEDGLPHNGVRDIVRDPDGFLWVGTLGGLARFDGRQFVEYRVPEDFMQGGHNIRALAVEDRRTLLLITSGNKVVRLRDGVFESHPVNASLHGVSLRDLALDEDGAVWIGTDASTVLRWAGGNLQTFTIGGNALARDEHFSFVPDGQGRMWVGGGTFLGWHDGEGLHEYSRTAGHSLVIAPSRSGGLWVAAREHLARLEGGRWSVLASGGNWPGRYGIRELLETRDGALWVATVRDTVWRLADNTLERVAPPHSRVMSIADDIDGNVWLGADGDGLIRVKPRRHVLLDSAKGFPADVSTSVCEDEDGALWCANQAGGVVRWKDGQAIVVSTEPGEPAPYANTVCVDRRGRVWAGTTAGLFRIDAGGGGARWILRRHAARMPNVQTLFCAANGDLWIGWDNGRLGVLRDGVLREFTQADAFPSSPFPVVSIVEREGGEIWVGADYGMLLRFDRDAGRFKAKTLFPTDRTLRLLAMFADDANRLWITTTRGLLLWRDGGKSRLFTRADGFPDDLAIQVVEDNHGRLWGSGPRGIFHVPIRRLLDAADTPGRKVLATLLGRDENLDGVSGILGNQPMAWKDRDGRVWFSTYRGVAGFEPPDPREMRKPPPVYIDGMAVDGGSLPIPDTGMPARVPPCAASLEIRFTALNFSTPERTHVRRMLEGFERDWIDAGNERACTYPRLPPGRYVFRVQAGDADSGILEQSETSLTLIVAAAWWQTWWARAGALLVFAAVVACCARVVSNRVLKRRLRWFQREHALDRERSRIARDLHDDLGGRMVQIGFVADSLRRKNTDPAQKERLGRLVTLSRHLIEDLHGIIWTVDSQNTGWRNLAAFLARHAQRHLSGTGIHCTVTGADDAIPDTPVTPEVQHHLLAVTKEALNNMLNHSDAGRVTINLSADKDRFHMSIEDNGRGFDTTVRDNCNGNGLANMRARMSEIGADIDIASAPGKGVRITVGIPLQCKPPDLKDRTDSKERAKTIRVRRSGFTSLSRNSNP
jgi:signal transduction histidine kinase/ligand-binding sensor domain-containing protein